MSGISFFQIYTQWSFANARVVKAGDAECLGFRRPTSTQKKNLLFFFLFFQRKSSFFVWFKTSISLSIICQVAKNAKGLSVEKHDSLDHSVEICKIFPASQFSRKIRSNVPIQYTLLETCNFKNYLGVFSFGLHRQWPSLAFFEQERPHVRFHHLKTIS